MGRTARDFSAGSLNAGYNSDFAGGVIGSDWTFGAGVGKGRIGLAFNVGTGDTKSRGDFNSTKNDFDFWGVSLYGGWSTDNINVVADFGYSASKNELKQDIPASLGMGGKLKADVDSSVLTTGVKAEYMVKTDVLDVMPHVGVRYMAVKTDSFSTKLDQGGDLFHTDGDLQHVWQFPVGVNLSKSFETESGWKIRPQADLSVVPAAGDTKAKIDVRTPGKNFDEFYRRAVEEYGVHYIKGMVGKVVPENGKLKVQASDLIGGRQLHIDADMVVLAAAIEPDETARPLATMLTASMDTNDFFTEAHPKLRPVESPTAGIFLSGACQGPKDIPETVAQAGAAASKVIGLLAKDHLTCNPCVAQPDEMMCNGCSNCEKVCPYGAITYIDKEFRGPNRTTLLRRVAQVNPAVCQGCGACTVACMSGAMDLKGFSNKQIMAEVDAICR